MKRLALGALAVVLVASTFVLAQNVAKPADVQPVRVKAEGPSAPAVTAKPLTVLGKVANDGKTFVTDIDTEWEVSNVDALKGYEGRLTTVKCYVDPERNRMHVLSVKAAEVKYASRQGDSAFRR
ncbi:MAG: hypothetical protein WCA16_06910 [Candidatus Sulfotelmatobacter sp.]